MNQLSFESSHGRTSKKTYSERENHSVAMLVFSGCQPSTPKSPSVLPVRSCAMGSSCVLSLSDSGRPTSCAAHSGTLRIHTINSVSTIGRIFYRPNVSGVSVQLILYSECEYHITAAAYSSWSSHCSSTPRCPASRIWDEIQSKYFVAL